MIAEIELDKFRQEIEDGLNKSSGLCKKFVPAQKVGDGK
jgi:hypothetical protein